MNLHIASNAPKFSSAASSTENPASVSARTAVAEPAANKPADVKSATAAKVHPDELSNALDEANRKLAADSREIRFEFDGGASKLIVLLIDTSTQEVLRQFPSNEALRFARLINAGKPILNTVA